MVWTWLLDLLYPPKCPFCRRILDDPWTALCGQCQETVPWLEGNDAIRKIEFTEGCYSPMAYRDNVPDSVHRFKFYGCPSFGRRYGILVAQCIQDHYEKPLDFVTWVPISKKRLRIRGYDQGRKLAEGVAIQLELPLQGTLKKIRHTQAQSTLSEDAQRRGNVLGAYQILDGVEVAGKHILLVDDVVTSGSTLEECARVLIGHGAAQVCCATLAQSRKNRQNFSLGTENCFEKNS